MNSNAGSGKPNCVFYTQREVIYKRDYTEKRHSNSFNYSHRDIPERLINVLSCAYAGDGFAQSEAVAVGLAKNFHVILDNYRDAAPATKAQRSQRKNPLRSWRVFLVAFVARNFFMWS